MSECFCQWSLDALFEKAQSGQPFDLPTDFEKQAEEYVHKMWSFPVRTFEISNISRLNAVKEADRRIKHILEVYNERTNPS